MTVIPMHAFPFLQLFACLALLYLTLPYLTLPTLPITRLLLQLPSRKKEKKVQKDKKSSKQQQITNNKNKKKKKKKRKNHVPTSHHHHNNQRNLTTTPLLPPQRPHPPLSPQHHLRPNSSPDFLHILCTSSLFVLFLRYYSHLRCFISPSPPTTREIEGEE